jgi:hypothetical protein
MRCHCDNAMSLSLEAIMAYSWPFAAVDDRYLVTFKGTLCGQLVMSTFWYRLTLMFAAPTVNDIMNGLYNKLIAANNLRQRYLEVCPANYSLDETWIQRIRPTRLVKNVYTENLNGLWSDDAQTGNTAAVIERRGVQAARNAVSTLHVPASSEPSAVSNGLITTAYKSGLQTLANIVATSPVLASGDILEPVIDNGIGAGNYTQIGSAFPQSTFRVMRRRTVGVGK